MKKKMSQWGKGFSEGYACACATLIRQHGYAKEVEDLFGSNFMSIEEMRKAGVPEDDIKVLSPVVKAIELRNA